MYVYLAVWCRIQLTPLLVFGPVEIEFVFPCALHGKYMYSLL